MLPILPVQTNPDDTARLRIQAQNEASLSPVAALKGLPSNLPDLRAGQTFVARIQQALPENSYRAVVEGREITLSLPGNVRAGDTLELVVVERSPRLVLAQPADLPGTADQQGDGLSRTTQLSPTGQMIGKLLLPAGRQPEAVPLNQGAPLLPSPPPGAGALAASLAPQLAQAAAQSGLFYEAHQALWLSGKHSTEALMQEPQARHPATTAARLAAATSEPGAVQGRDSGDAEAGSFANPHPQAAAGAKDLLQSIPAELRSLVQQQLDAATTQRMIWQGEVWPGQVMQWQVSREAPDQSNPSPDETGQWDTTLALTTPKLGRIEARLGISDDAVRIALVAQTAETAPKLTNQLPKLQAALKAAGLTPVGLQVRNEDG